IDEVMDLFRERTRSQGIFLRARIGKDVPDRIVSDPTRLRQILINIVGNAVKFTQTGGVTIEVEALVFEEAGLCFAVRVTDTGRGMTREQANKLFQPFTQADSSTTREFGGTGLGLVLSRRLANALNGEIEIEACEPTRGCTFLVTFKAELAEVVTHPAFSIPAAGITNLAGDSLSKSTSKAILRLQDVRILVADDSVDNVYLVQRLLSKHGAIVMTANNGADAFRSGIKNQPDLILMDIQMPEMDGYEATRALREAGYNRPIIALTAHAMAEERARTVAAGCSGHLTKPLNNAELLDMIEQFAGKTPTILTNH
ncbi:MAG: response regulator, partial [Pseudomonas sp.]